MQDMKARRRCCLALPVWCQWLEEFGLNAGRESSDVFRQARHGFSAMRFVLDAIHTHEGIRAAFRAAELRCKSRDGIEPHGRRCIAVMG